MRFRSSTTSSAGTTSRTRTTPLAIGGTALIACTYGLARYGFGLFVPTFRAEFDLSTTVTGLFATGGLGSYCAAALCSRWLLARGRARTTVALAGGLAATGCAGIALATTPRALGLTVLVAGCGAGLASPALVAIVAEAVAPDRRERTQTVVNAGTSLGVMAAGPIALVWADAWRAAWWVFALASAAATLATVLAAPRGTSRPSSPAATPAPRPAQLGPALAAAVLAGAGSAAVWTFGRELVVEAGDLGPVAATTFWTCIGAAGVAGAAAGDAAERWTVAGTWTTVVAAQSVATVLLALAPGTVVVAYGCAAVFGAAYVAASGVLIAWGTELAPEAPGPANALCFLALAAGQAAGALGLGAMYDRVGPPVTFAVAGLLGIVGCLPAWRFHRFHAVRRKLPVGDRR